MIEALPEADPRDIEVSQTSANCKWTRAIQCFCVSVSVCVILYLAHALPKKFFALRKNRSRHANFSQSETSIFSALTLEVYLGPHV